MEEVGLILGMFAAVYGITDLMLRLAFRLLFVDSRDRAYTVIIGNDEECTRYRLWCLRCLLPSKTTAITLVREEDKLLYNEEVYTVKEFSEMMDDRLQSH